MDPIYFISDVHLGAASLDQEDGKLRRLLLFLRGLRGRAPLLYIVGDLFDFWFEYRSAILKQHFRVLHEMAGLIESGTHIVYLAGNHDFWLGTFLHEQVGVEVVYGPLEVEHQGKRMLICHGDGMIAKDWGYRFMRMILHNQTNIRLFQLVHPDIGVWLGRIASRMSRNHGAPTSWEPDQAYRELALMKLKNGYDCVIFGHIHHPTYEEIDGKVYVNTGDWVRHFTYGVMTEGALSLEWLEGEKSSE